jgi:hypothetical protein
MKKGIVLGVVFLFVFMSFTSISGVQINENIIKSSDRGNILYVGGSGPGNYSSIIEAVDDASDGDTVFVYDDSSPYYENILIDKSINLIGENKASTIIDGNQTGDVIYISDNANGGIVKGFTIQNSGNEKWKDAGIEVWCFFDSIIDNIIVNNLCGINVRGSEENLEYCRDISYNVVVNNEMGVNIDKNIGNVTPTNVYENYISNNTYGIIVSPINYINEYHGIRNNLYQNVITNNEYGIGIANGIYQNVFKNNISNNKCGISLDGYHGLCFNNNIYQNNIERNEDGIVLLDICTGGSHNNNIYLNSLKNNNKGILITNWDTGFCPSGNKIYHNNFIKNNISASIQLENKYNFGWNLWAGNYWNRPRILPKIISGYNFIFPLFNIDWSPAKKPNDISSAQGCDIE